MNKKSYLIIIFAFLILLTALYLYNSSFKKVIAYNYWVNHTEEVIFSFDTLSNDIQSAEVVPFLLNSNKNKIIRYYSKGIGDILYDINRLRKLTADNEQQQKRVDSLSAIIQRQLPLRKWNTSDSVGFTDFFSIQQLIANGVASEKKLLGERRINLEVSVYRTSIIIIIFIITSLVLIIGITASNIYHVIKRKNAELFLEAVLHTSQNGIVTMTAIRKNRKIEDFKIIYANDSMGKQTGLRPIDLLGKTLLSAFPAEIGTGIMDKYVHVCETGKKAEIETSFTRHQVTRWLHIMLAKLNDGLTATIYDITDLKTYQVELQNKVDQLEYTNNELEQFAYVASHDLQEPLRKIKTFASLIDERFNDPAASFAKVYINKVIFSANRMSNLISDLLNLSDLSKQRKSFTETDLNTIIHNVLDDFELVIQEKGGVIRVDDLLHIEAVPLQMNQLFYNLINNALKFSKDNVPPQIDITSTLLLPEQVSQYNLKQELSYQKIIIRDNGIGFNPVYAEKIFVIFQRLNSKQLYSGSGIGLALCKKIVQNHHGMIYAEGNEEEGAVFCVVLPLKQPKAVLHALT